MKLFISPFKKIVAAHLVMFSSLAAFIVFKPNITQQARREAESFIRQQGFNPYDIPAKLQAEYDQNIDLAAQNLIARITREGRGSVDSWEIENEIRLTLQNFSDSLKTIILSRDLDYKASDIIRYIAHNQGVDPRYLSSSLSREYNQKKESIIRQMRTLMAQDSRNYVRIHEVERETRSVMNEFLNRAKQNSTSNTYSTNNYSSTTNTSANSWDSWWDSFFNSSANNNTPYNTPNNTPSNTTSNYLSSTQAPNNNTAPSTSFTNNLIGEICAICQDGYKSGDKAGQLNCKHIFHNGCIYQWLTFQKTCPLCRQNNVIVAKQELVR